MDTARLQEAIRNVGSMRRPGDPAPSEALTEQALASVASLLGEGIIDPADYPVPVGYKDLERAVRLKKAIELSRMPFESAWEASAGTIENGRTLQVVASDRCTKACVHCLVDSVAQGATLPLERLAGADPRIITQFPRIHFGYDGEPLQVRSPEGAGLADYLAVLYEKGARMFAVDTKGFRPQERRSAREYQRVREFVQAHPDVRYWQNISFNLYSPDVFQRPRAEALPILRDELLPVLREAMQFAQRVLIRSSCTIQREPAGEGKTAAWLAEILEGEGFTAIRPLAPRVFYTQSPGFDREELAAYRRAGGMATIVFSDRPTPGNPFYAVLAIMAGDQDPLLQVPEKFVDKSGYEVLFHPTLTVNTGRWVQERKRLGQQPWMRDAERVRRSDVCYALLLDGFRLSPRGEIGICTGAHEQFGMVVPIDAPYERFMEAARGLHERNALYVQEHARLIAAGRDETFMCIYQGPTNPPRGQALELDNRK